MVYLVLETYSFKFQSLFISNLIVLWILLAYVRQEQLLYKNLWFVYYILDVLILKNLIITFDR